MWYNSDYLIYMIPAFILMMLVSWYVNATYKKWSSIQSRSQMTGYDAAKRLLAAGGLYNVQIEAVSGKLSDHYDPKGKVLRLSQGVGQGSSVASLAVVAHEMGHAKQDAENYFPLRLRSALVPLVNIGSYMGWIFIILGLILSWIDLAWIGVIAFAGGAVFALATIPVEVNASKRARALLSSTGIITSEDEMRGVGKVLNAAALTYVAGLVTAILQLLYYASMVIGLGGRRR